MPNANAPKAPCVAVWLSPHTTVVPGRVKPWMKSSKVSAGWELPYEGAIEITFKLSMSLLGTEDVALDN